MMPNHFTTTEAAARLGLTPRRVRALCAAGHLPAAKVGRDWIIAQADLDAFRPRKAGRPPKPQTD